MNDFDLDNSRPHHHLTVSVAGLSRVMLSRKLQGAVLMRFGDDYIISAFRNKQVVYIAYSRQYDIQIVRL